MASGKLPYRNLTSPYSAGQTRDPIACFAGGLPPQPNTAGTLCGIRSSPPPVRPDAAYLSIGSPLYDATISIVPALIAVIGTTIIHLEALMLVGRFERQSRHPRILVPAAPC